MGDVLHFVVKPDETLGETSDTSEASDAFSDASSDTSDTSDISDISEASDTSDTSDPPETPDNYYDAIDASDASSDPADPRCSGGNGRGVVCPRNDADCTPPVVEDRKRRRANTIKGLFRLAQKLKNSLIGESWRSMLDSGDEIKVIDGDVEDYINDPESPEWLKGCLDVERRSSNDERVSVNPSVNIFQIVRLQSELRSLYSSSMWDNLDIFLDVAKNVATCKLDNKMASAQFIFYATVTNREKFEAAFSNLRALLTTAFPGSELTHGEIDDENDVLVTCKIHDVALPGEDTTHRFSLT